MAQPTIIPTVRMPCTINIGSDRYAAEILEIRSPKRIVIRRLWSNAEREVWSFRKDGRWRPAGSGFNSGYSLTLGEAVDYLDPSF